MTDWLIWQQSDFWDEYWEEEEEGGGGRGRRRRTLLSHKYNDNFTWQELQTVKRGRLPEKAIAYQANRFENKKDAKLT